MKYTEDHEWVRIEGGVAVIGISKYAAEQLGDLVYVELPALGDKVTKGKELGAVDSSKTASDVFSPISGEVIDVNAALNDDVEEVRIEALKGVEADPEGAGWFIKVRPDNAAEIDDLMDATAYAAYVETL